MLRCRHTSDPALCPSSHLIVLVEVGRVEEEVVVEVACYREPNCVVVSGAEACERE